jgi:hypothetical protein
VLSHRDVHIFISLRLTGEPHSLVLNHLDRITFTCAQPQARPTPQISFSLRYIGESSGASHHLNSLHRGGQYIITIGITFTCAQPHARPTQHISFSLRYTRESFGVSHHLNSLHRGGQYIVSSLSQNDTPNSWASPHRGIQHSISVSVRNHTPSSWASPPQSSISVSERNHTPISWAHPTHGLPHPTQGYTQRSFSVSEKNNTPISWAHRNSWALSQADSLSQCPGGCLMQL